MTIFRPIGAGLAAAASHKRLVVLLWVVHLVLALGAAFPVWRWLAEAFSLAPAADSLLAAVSAGLFKELLQYDRYSPALTVGGEVYALALLGALLNPLLAAGVLEVVASRDQRPLLHRFFRGAGHFYGRFLRLLVIGGAVAVVLVVAVMLATAPGVRGLAETSAERLWLAASAARLLLAAAALAMVVVVTDLARARVMVEPDRRGMVRAWFGAALFAFVHVRGVAAVYVALGLLAGALFVAYALLAAVLPAISWTGILVMLVLQQGFVAGRAALRITRAGASLALVRAHLPALPEEAAGPAVAVPVIG